VEPRKEEKEEEVNPLSLRSFVMFSNMPLANHLLQKDRSLSVVHHYILSIFADTLHSSRYLNVELCPSCTKHFTQPHT
jgi:hypothetical protein